MKPFLRQLSLGLAKLALSFLALAATARFVPTVNWFFFQKNDHDRVFYMLLEAEKSLAEGKRYDVLVFGSSTCENALDPQRFSEMTGLSVFKFVTGAQTLDMSAALARYCAPRFHSRYVLVDAYPRYGGELTEEGVERILINSPDATSDLTLAALSIYPQSFTVDYLWLARVIGTWIKPYDAGSIMAQPSQFEMLAPGYTRAVADPPAMPQPFSTALMPPEAITCMNALDTDLSREGRRLLLLVPPLQNATIQFASRPDFPLLIPDARPDTCFFDERHMRGTCVRDYTDEVSRRFNAFRAREHLWRNFSYQPQD